LAVQHLAERIRLYGLNHDSLSILTVINGVVVNETPLRIGKGRGELGEHDLPVLRDLNGIPYVPGSSLKGALRAFAEALVRGSGGRACTPFDSECAFGSDLLNYILQLALERESLDEVAKGIDEKRVKEIAFRRLEAEKAKRIVDEVMKLVQGSSNGVMKLVDTYAPCPVCRLFGNTALAARVTIFDMYPEDSRGIAVVVRTRVAIDRLREAARTGALFDYEFVPPGFRWRFRMEVKNLNLLDCNTDECTLLRSLIKFFATHGIAVGGMKSVGHGLLKLVANETTILVYRVEKLGISEPESRLLSEVVAGW